MGKAAEVKNTVNCSRCGKNHYPENSTSVGNHIGAGPTLARNILNAHYGSVAQSAHPLSEPGGQGHTAEAHHLINSENMSDDDEWEEICSNYGYDINSWQNGALLPRAMRIACELEIPLHYGNHDETYLKKNWWNYVDVVKNLLKPIKAKARKKDYCSDPNANIIKDLNDLSQDIWIEVKNFNLTITYDGKDYDIGGVGCLGHSTLKTKKMNQTIPWVSNCIQRKHKDPEHRKRMIKAKLKGFFKERE